MLIWYCSINLPVWFFLHIYPLLKKSTFFNFVRKVEQKLINILNREFLAQPFPKVDKVDLAQPFLKVEKGCFSIV